MPRPPRIDFPGAWHHVMNRGADHRDVFQHDADCSVFLDSLATAADRTGLEVHAYCLMTNHFHLLVRSQQGHIASGMQYLLGRFTRLVNLRVKRDGPLFRGRYASVPVGADHQILQVCRYIHLNPVMARLTSRPEAWRWSSAAAYVGAAPAPRWLRTDAVFDFFDAGDRLSGYRDFMAAGTDSSTAEFYAGLGW